MIVIRLIRVVLFVAVFCTININEYSCSSADFENNNLTTNLNYLATKFQTIDKTLEDLQNSVNLNQEEACFTERKSLGLTYNSCSKQKAQTEYPKDCLEIIQSGIHPSGIYEISPDNSDHSILVQCEMAMGGWTQIQKRHDGSTDFSRNWRDYKFGFGNLEGEFWLGLQSIYLLTASEPSELLVELIDRDNVQSYAHYSSFAIGPEPEGYTLETLSGYSGDAGDPLSGHHLGSKFSTEDLDFTNVSCATQYHSGWWFNYCHRCNLNGKYRNIDLPSTDELAYKGMHWSGAKGLGYSFAKSRMMVRRLN